MNYKSEEANKFDFNNDNEEEKKESTWLTFHSQAWGWSVS